MAASHNFFQTWKGLAICILISVTCHQVVGAAPIIIRKKALAATRGGCTTANSEFWRSKFQSIVDGLIQGAAVGADTNARIASSMKRQLTAAEGCGTQFEALVWEGTHGHDHQGANVLTPDKYCDGGMSQSAPGSTCGLYGGTYHEFRTGGGKSFAVFINPAGAAGDIDESVNIASIVDSCQSSANLLIDWTACINKKNRKKVGLRGVIAIPTEGVMAPSDAGGGLRANLWRTSFSCSTASWVWCKSDTWGGRDLTVFVVKPRKNRGGAF